MSIRADRATTLARLHVKGRPLILFNVWDAGSAKTVAAAGARAIATGSWSVAAAHGYDDGEALPLDLAIANVERIVASVDLPVTMDIESGYGVRPDEVRTTLERVISAGVVGINFEDGVIGAGTLYSIEAQCARIRALREAADSAVVPVFINARTDVYLNADPADHGEDHFSEALERAAAYAEAGASGFFVPGLRDTRWIERLCDRSPLPVNVMATPDSPSLQRLSEAGVARVSHGPGPYRLAMAALADAAAEALEPGQRS